MNEKHRATDDTGYSQSFVICCSCGDVFGGEKMYYQTVNRFIEHIIEAEELVSATTFAAVEAVTDAAPVETSSAALQNETQP